jgi:glycine C-acetyltransferase
MYEKIWKELTEELKQIKQAGLFKEERIILTDQKANIQVSYPAGSEAKSVLNFCANNYLGLANHPELVQAARQALDKYGLGLASVRFICGTQNIHTRLEKTISDFYQTDDTILYTSCFDANGGLFEGILRPEDAIVTDELNHASIIDGIRLCKAERFIFKHGNMDSLEESLQNAREGGRDESASASKRIMVATDGVFSMDGNIANLRGIVDLAKKYQALVMVDDSHATGFLGKTGRGSLEYCDVLGEIDIVTSTLGKAMGGASGGFTTGRKEIIDMLRQRSRPYLFSNTLAPALVSAAIRAFQLLDKSDDLRKKLMENTRFFRQKMIDLGFDIIQGSHPIVPIMFRKFDDDALLAQQVSKDLYEMGIYVIGFFYPVVPRGQARIRVQVSAAHTQEHLQKAIDAFKTVGKKHGVIQ